MVHAVNHTTLTQRSDCLLPLNIKKKVKSYDFSAIQEIRQLMKLHRRDSVSGCTESKDLERKVQYLTKGMLSYLFSEL